MELRDYVRILRQRWILIAVTVLLALAAASALTLTTTAQYQSTARLFVSTSESNTTDAYQGGLFSQQRITSYASLITGEEMARRVAEELDSDISPRALADQITATVEPETVVLEISVTDASADRARELTQTTAEVFTEYVTELETPPGQTTAPVKASITDRASAPGSPVSPQPVRNLGLALVLGLLLGVGIAVLRETLDTRIKSPRDLQEATGDAPALGHISYDKRTPKQPLLSSLDSHSPRAEAFRVLRTNVQFLNVDSAGRVFVVTSALPGEGKSTTACNLALALADGGFSVLLVEADLRRPKATGYFGLEPNVGVTTVLLGKVGFEDAVQEVSPRCALMASGPTPPNPSELLQSEAMHRLLTEARQRYDYVLVDVPPLLPVTDAAVLAAQADGALLVVRHNKTTSDQVEAAVDRLESVGAKLLGSITNMSPTSKRASGYGYGYGYGYAPDASTVVAEPTQGTSRGRRGGRRAAGSGGSTGRRAGGAGAPSEDPFGGPHRRHQPGEPERTAQAERPIAPDETAIEDALTVDPDGRNRPRRGR
ncbi:polysaccharide biosynthesis tyrosine autokinase [Aeromicrobium sp. CF4.19]|uniref:polysaccharide biosynthesis tyrosine autokinase n=1 Tax=Aeromicrobium sp. CF4.19 TaxID=3373082 RepID=UPI003EE75891